METDDLASDMLDGMREIAAFLRIPERRCYDWAEKGKIPAFKVGERKWQARKSTLRRHIERLEGMGAV
jgi:excisionase family DNA binding protein